MDSSEEQSRKIAHDAEKDLNSYGAKAGHGMATSKGYEAQTSKGLTSDSTRESGVDKAVENKFPGAHVVYGSAAPGSGGDKIIPAQEGGDQLPGRGGGRPTRASDFEGQGGPEDKARAYAEAHPGNDDVKEY